jgi:hypothetical protein
MPPALTPWSKTWPVQCYCSPMLCRLPFFGFDVYVMYTSIFLHILMYKKCVLTFPHSQTPNHSRRGCLGLGSTHGASLVRVTHHRSS